MPSYFTENLFLAPSRPFSLAEDLKMTNLGKIYQFYWIYVCFLAELDAQYDKSGVNGV